MSKPYDGGPAFPSHAGDPEMNDPRNRISCGGMTLRDWFAGQALAGMAVNAKASGPDAIGGLQAKLAELSYSMADAMLKAREATP